jgi:hypothetical protein
MQQVHVVGWVIASRDPSLVFLCKEASLVDEANANFDKCHCWGWDPWQGLQV